MQLKADRFALEGLLSMLFKLLMCKVGSGFVVVLGWDRSGREDRSSLNPQLEFRKFNCE